MWGWRVNLKFSNLTFQLHGSELYTVDKVEYLGHVIMNTPDYEDMNRQCCKLYAQTNMLAYEFILCTDEVKITQFIKAFTTVHLWFNYSRVKCNKLQVVYNDVLHKLLKAPQWISASLLCVLNNEPSLNAVMKNSVQKFMNRLVVSKNETIKALIRPKESSIRYSSGL